jgi:hypothetical protein
MASSSYLNTNIILAAGAAFLQPRGKGQQKFQIISDIAELLNKTIKLWVSCSLKKISPNC